ncbi:hypothetical protein SOASR030_01870 [Leminorella grimontii]|uniref:Uncharacterized protein n=1 Tax=Leminorella grimontii TaxID=82981 RepID=A0AAV5MW55_9GAMM|nr:hypothetical protein [Leminorella grimontii]KFC95741.1 hypothetical protein GLGR_1904 [Leminorella grimontii ATCC 33999 = DSM 5078]GKX54075.1 hypothetical protein SOASR030_01870 [Leminorella grimontii]VFS60140.1 Uncharacterised protein [Leminorella grimontii]
MNINQPNNKPVTQLQRVIDIATRGSFTLTEIQRQIRKEFGLHDQETSISARIREATQCGYRKTRQAFKNEKTGRVHYRYQLTKRADL